MHAPSSVRRCPALDGDGPRRERPWETRPGPIPLPPRSPRLGARAGWAVAAAVVVLAAVVYFVTRPTVPIRQTAPPPTWGTLTLSQVVVSQARRAGDAHPGQATWLSTYLNQALAVLAPGTSSSAEAVFAVTLHGEFQPATSAGALHGSLARGPVLVVLVAGFDGSVAGWQVTSVAPPGLARLGVSHRLALGLL